MRFDTCRTMYWNSEAREWRTILESVAAMTDSWEATVSNTFRWQITKEPLIIYSADISRPQV